MENNLFGMTLLGQINKDMEGLADLDGAALVDTINKIRLEVWKYSPFKHEPVDCVQWVNQETVVANDYNPNAVAPPEMKLLEVSIMSDGFTQPIVTFDEGEHLEVVDGFHRNRIGKESKEVGKRINGYLPVVKINQDRSAKGDRIASTIRHNRARGKHRVDAMSDIVVDLRKRNWSNEKIARELGMDQDEVLRLSQITGLAEMFIDRQFSEAWDACDSDIIGPETLTVEDENCPDENS